MMVRLFTHLSYALRVKSSRVFVYCVNVKEKTDYILIIAVTDASMIYREGTYINLQLIN